MPVAPSRRAAPFIHSLLESGGGTVRFLLQWIVGEVVVARVRLNLGVPQELTDYEGVEEPTVGSG